VKIRYTKLERLIHYFIRKIKISQNVCVACFQLRLGPDSDESPRPSDLERSLNFGSKADLNSTC
jgi:hypothetical protein